MLPAKGRDLVGRKAILLVEDQEAGQMAEVQIAKDFLDGLDMIRKPWVAYVHQMD